MSTGPVKYDIALTEEAADMLRRIGDGRIREKISEIIDDLEFDPDRKGKPLVDDLSGLYSRRAVGQRYRSIFSIDDPTVSVPRGKVIVRAVGIRKEGDKRDIYVLAQKMRARGEI